MLENDKNQTIPFPQPHILIVEDEMILRNTLVRMLTRAGFKTSEAIDGIDAIDKMEEMPADIILTDILMPEHDGVEFIRNMRDIDEDIPIIAMSGGGRMGAADYLDAVYEIGANAILRKPFSRHDLLEIIYEHIAETNQNNPQNVVSPEGFEPSTY